jgi:hypothetical protein
VLGLSDTGFQVSRGGGRAARSLLSVRTKVSRFRGERVGRRTVALRLSPNPGSAVAHLSVAVDASPVERQREHDRHERQEAAHHDGESRRDVDRHVLLPHECEPSEREAQHRREAGKP